MKKNIKKSKLTPWMIANFEPGLRKQFKVLCAQKGVKMWERIEKLVKSDVASYHG